MSALEPTLHDSSAPVVLPTHTPTLCAQAVAEAARLLRAGEPVVLPTETVYGLAANALDTNAVHKIYAIKGRPPHNPLIVHVDGLAMARSCTSDWPELADRLAAAFWPGPLTLVLPKAALIPAVVTAGGSTVAVRWPSHPIMQAVIRACGFPLAAPSANRSNQISPTHPSHVQMGLGQRVGLIVDGGQCQVGIESTVLDLTVDPPRVLRPGVIGASALAAVTGCVTTRDSSGAGEILRSPGLMDRHYAPRAELRMLTWHDDAELVERIRAWTHDPTRVHVIAHSHIPSGQLFGRVSVIPHDAEAFARAIYGEMHACDAAGANWIVVEALPEGEAWEAIADRLRRAGGDSGSIA